jgi:prolyl-tRNA editing enzyme YbaK/EbsC (Cys-tRNA(Pro) deacylase)
MSIEKVKRFFEQFGLADKILEFAVSSATVELAAQAIGCEPQRIAKTLSFKVKDKVILIVVAGDARIDNRKFKERFSTKAKMLTPEEVITFTGYPVGGVCPFAVGDEVDIYLDKSLKRFNTVFPACGSGNSAIELTIEELEKYSRHTAWVDVCSGWS